MNENEQIKNINSKSKAESNKVIKNVVNVVKYVRINNVRAE